MSTLVAVLVLGMIPMLAGAGRCFGQGPTGALSVDNGSGAPGSSVSLAVRMTNDAPADGFSFGLSHDPALLTVLSASPGAALDPLQGGIAPDVFLVNTAPVGGSGFTVGCLVDLGPPPFISVPAGVSQSIVSVSYGVLTSATPATTSLDFSGTLGSPPVEMLLVLSSIEVTPTLSSGSFEVLPIAYVRGDCNGDGTINLGDAVVCLRRLFGVDPPGSCADAEDIDDNGALEVTDAVFLLQFLFAGGPPVPPPLLACGNDPTADALNCAAFAACP